MRDQEYEIKYFISDLEAVEWRVQSLGATLIQPRTHEFNLRFDTSDGELTSSYQVLRLRQDTATHLTYKGPGYEQNGVRVRQEIEFTVSDFNAARKLLQVLGFQIVMIYEKYRTTYDLDGTHITLDQMPYGDFLEIEGVDSDSIQLLNQRLGLNWDARIPVSYTSLFTQVKERLGLKFRDLIFENFDQMVLHPEDLGVSPADE